MARTSKVGSVEGITAGEGEGEGEEVGAEEEEEEVGFIFSFSLSLSVIIGSLFGRFLTRNITRTPTVDTIVIIVKVVLTETPFSNKRATMRLPMA